MDNFVEGKNHCLFLIRLTFQSSKAIPVSRQMPIFDYEAEADHIIAYLERLKVSELLRCLLPTFVCILFQELEKECPKIDLIKSQIKRLSEDIKKIDWSDLSVSFMSSLRLIILVKITKFVT